MRVSIRNNEQSIEIEQSSIDKFGFTTFRFRVNDSIIFILDAKKVKIEYDSAMESLVFTVSLAYSRDNVVTVFLDGKLNEFERDFKA